MSHSHFSKAEMSAQETKKQKVTVVQSILIGSIAGAMEVFVNHPLWSIKTRMQRGFSFTLNPYVLYRGILPNAASMMPITAMQVGLDRCFQGIFFKDARELTNSKKVVSAFFAGVGSAFASCPTEMIMTYQGKTGGSFHDAGKHLFTQGGFRCVFTGLFATAMRDGLFTAFVLAVSPILKVNIQPFFPNYAASLIAGVGAGVGATIATQAVDTIKTIQQASNPLQPDSFMSSAKKVYSTQGAHGFFKGGLPRGARVISAVTIIGGVKEKMEAKFRRE